VNGDGQTQRRSDAVVPEFDVTRSNPMSELQAIADRFEIEALRGEFTDTVRMRDYDHLASLFTRGSALQMPYINVELAGQEEIRAWGERVPAVVDYLVQITHPGTIRLDGDTASGHDHTNGHGGSRLES
jgi:hypothetical protein